MTAPLRFTVRVATIVALLVPAGCGSGGGDGTGTAGSGSPGAAGSGGPGAAGAGGTTGNGGFTPGAGGSTAGASATAGTTGGATAGAGGASGSTAGTTGGSSAGRGGGGGATGGAVAGASGTAGRGGGGGTTGMAGRGGTTGTAGTTGTGGAGSGDAYVSGVMVAVHPQTTTILNVTWTQAMAADQVFLEFSFTGSGLMTSRAKPGATGAKRDVVLGVPSATAITVRIVSRVAGVDYKTRDYTGTTGALPADLPRPMILAYNAQLASPHKWMFGSVEDSTGGCTNRNCYFSGGLFWVYIMDRQGRIVWYYADGTSNAATGFQRIAKDGEYIWIEKSRTGTRGVTKMTLDRQYMQNIAVAGLADAIDVTDDGALLYDANSELRELSKAGATRTIWSCRTAFGASYNCYSNTVNWNKADNTVLMSFPEPNTVAQINRQTGELVATYGDRSGSYTFSPASWSLEWQHFPNISKDGTLMVSSHLPMFPEGSAAGPMQHAFIEFEIDRTARRLVERWSYSAGTEWALSRGMVIKLANGNYLGNYGTGGAIRELTPDKQLAFHVKFDVPTGSDYANKMVGHNELIDDLYALNGGGPQ